MNRTLKIVAAVFACVVAIVALWPVAKKAYAQIFVPAGCYNTTSTTNGVTFNSCVTASPTQTPTAAPTATATPALPTPAQADSLVDMVGLNTHLPYGSTAYNYCWNVSCSASGNTVLSAIHDLGVRHLRDGIPASDTADLAKLASACSTYGIHTGIITSMPNENNQGGTGTSAANMGSIATQLGTGCLDYFENDNEQDNSGDASWVADLMTQQQRMWNARSVNFPAGVQIVGPSLTSEQSITALFAGAPTMANYMDQSNGHYYWSARWPETPGYGGAVDNSNGNLGCPSLPASNCGTYGSLQTNLNATAAGFPGKTVMVTESGYPDNTESMIYPQNPLDNYWVDNTTKSKYITRLFLNAYATGVRRLYLYELVDEGGAPFSQMGIMDYGAYKKASFTALNNLLNIHRDPGGSFSPTPYAVSIAAASDVKNALFQRRDGTNIIDLWQTDSSWNPDASTPISNATKTATITLGTTPTSVAIYTLNPVNGQLTVTNPTASRTISVPVTDGFVSVVLGIPAVPIVLATANPYPSPSPTPTLGPTTAKYGLTTGTASSFTLAVSSPPPVGSTFSGAYMIDGNSVAGNLAGQILPSTFSLIGGPVTQAGSGGTVSALAFCHNVTTTETGSYTFQLGGQTDAINAIGYVTVNSHCPTNSSDYAAATSTGTTFNGPNLFPTDTTGTAYDLVGQIGTANTVTGTGGAITWAPGLYQAAGYGSITSFTGVTGGNVEHDRTTSAAMASAAFTYVIPSGTPTAPPSTLALVQTSSVVTPAPALSMAPTVAATPPAGQLALACAAVNNGNTIATPPGWNLQLAANVSGASSLYVFWKFTTNAEPTSLTLTGSTNTYMSAAIRYYQGVNPTTPFAGVAINVGSSTSISPTSITAQPYGLGTMPVSCFTTNTRAGVTAHTAGATEDYTAYSSSQSGNGFVSGFNGTEGQTGPIASATGTPVPYTASATWNVTNGNGPVPIQYLGFLAPVGASVPILEGYIADLNSNGFNAAGPNFGVYGNVTVITTGATLTGPSPAPGVFFRAFGAVNNPTVNATRVDYSLTPFPGSPTPAPTSSPVVSCFANGAHWASTCVPYSTSSLWNQQLASSPAIDHTSDSIIAVMFPSTTNSYVQAYGSEPGQFDNAVQLWFASNSDPLVYVDCPVGDCNGYVSGTPMRLPAKFHLGNSGQDNPGVIVQPDGTEYDVYCYDIYDHLLANGGNDGYCGPHGNTITGGGTLSAGDHITLNPHLCGNFFNGAGWQGAATVNGGATADSITAGGNCGGAGLLNAKELYQGAINHAIQVVPWCTTNKHVFPAFWSADGTQGPCSGPVPTVGQRLWYDVPCATTQATSLYPFQKAILCALNKYGAYVTDNQGDTQPMQPGIGIRGIGEVNAYLNGVGDQWAPLAAQGWSSYNVGGDWSPSWPRWAPGDSGNWPFPGADFKDHMHFLQVCVTQGTC